MDDIFFSKYQYHTTPIVRGKNKLMPLLNLIADKGVICGGMARWMLSLDKDSATPGDIDLYPFSSLIFNELQPQLDSKMFRVWESKGSISYSQTAFNDPGNFSVQLIKPDIVKVHPGAGTHVEMTQSILDKFDFTVCKAAVGKFNGKIVGVKVDAFDEDDKAKKLRIHHINCPIATLLRSLKYREKGYKLSALEVIKCLEHWRNITPEETRVKAAEFLSKQAKEEMSFQELYELITFID